MSNSFYMFVGDKREKFLEDTTSIRKKNNLYKYNRIVGLLPAFEANEMFIFDGKTRYYDKKRQEVIVMSIPDEMVFPIDYGMLKNADYSGTHDPWIHRGTDHIKLTDNAMLQINYQKLPTLKFGKYHFDEVDRVTAEKIISDESYVKELNRLLAYSYYRLPWYIEKSVEENISRLGETYGRV